MEFVGCAGFLGIVWLFHLVPSLLVSLPIWIRGNRRVSWLWSDYATVILPFVVWATLFAHDNSGKTLSNFVEGFWLGCLVPASSIVRVVVGKRGKEMALSLALLATLCIAAAGLWRFTPGLPE